LKLERDIPFNMIGNEGGLLSGAPVVRTELLLGPAERADVIVDFSGLAVGERFLLVNTGPDEPYQGPTADQSPADPETTGKILELRVIEKSSNGVAGAIPSVLPVVDRLVTELPPRDLTLNEIVYEAADIPIEAQLGTAEKGPLGWEKEPTETPTLGDTEIWRFLNLTADTHPIHLHLVMFQVLDRTPLDAEGYQEAQAKFLAGDGPAPKVDDYLSGAAMPAKPWENGLKDTVLANPNEMTRIVAKFDIAGLYVWHCHILEHEDNEMMRPFEVLLASGPR
jgi:FtsP/CotA-like multicopper oxidase with cupredoxin domain